MNKRSVGSEYERLACSYLRNKGYDILAANYYSKHGELDIVAMNSAAYVFVEVKYRSGDSFGSPFDAITPRKIKAMRYAATDYLLKNGIGTDVNMRFDVIGITRECGQIKITHLEDAL